MINLLNYTDQITMYGETEKSIKNMSIQYISIRLSGIY